VTAEIAAKSLRRAQRAIREAGTDNIVPLLQGRLAAGDVIAEAGLSAQPKAAKPRQAP
jgi:predicted O-methyltransferase YrrM